MYEIYCNEQLNHGPSACVALWVINNPKEFTIFFTLVLKLVVERNLFPDTCAKEFDIWEYTTVSIYAGTRIYHIEI